MSVTRRALLAGLAATMAIGLGTARSADAKNPVVIMETTLGAIHIEMNPEKAPITVKNFLAYVNSGHYNGLSFHRVIPGFMIQGGGMTPDMQERATKAPIKNECKNGLKNSRGTLSMARTSDPDSATSQFFINVANNEALDFPNAQGSGYAVFARVTKGMDVVDKIVGVETGTRGFHQNVPVKAIVIKSAKVQK